MKQGKIPSFLWLLIWISTLWAMEQPMEIEKKELKELKIQQTGFTIPAYYTPEKLEEFEKQGLQKSLACLMIFDPLGKELSNVRRSSQVLTDDLAAAIEAGFFPILISNSILYNLAENLNEGRWAQLRNRLIVIDKQRIKLMEFNKENWELYSLPAAPLSLLIPKRFRKFYEQDLNLSKLQNLTSILDAKETPPETAMEKVLHYFQTKPLHFSEPLAKKPFTTTLHTIFRTTPNTELSRWSFIIDGHGAHREPPLIVGLSVEETNALLSFFDSLNTSFVYLYSCELGGKNLSLLQFEKSGFSIDHSYMMLVGTVSDFMATLAFTPQFLHDFFNFTATFYDKGKSLNKFLSLLSPFSEESSSIHKIPQVWLPYGLGFQTFNIDEYILSLGNVMKRVHEDQKTAIKTGQKNVVLIYPASLQTTIIEKANYSEVRNNLTGLFMRAPDEASEVARYLKKPTINALIEKNEYLFDEHFPTISKLAKQNAFIDETSNNYFPLIISMIHGNAVHYIKEMQADQSTSPLFGVMLCIRDSFFSMGEKLSDSKIFLIDTFKGHNDLSLILEIEKFLELAEKNDLFQSWHHPLMPLIKDMPELALRKVKIQVGPKRQHELAFELGNKAWQLKYKRRGPDDLSLFGIQEIDLTAYEKEFAHLVAQVTIEDRTQKSITEVLEGKIKKISQSKKRKERTF